MIVAELFLMRLDLIQMSNEARVKFLEDEDKARMEAEKAGKVLYAEQALTDLPNEFPDWLRKLIFKIPRYTLYERIRNLWRKLTGQRTYTQKVRWDGSNQVYKIFFIGLDEANYRLYWFSNQYEKALDSDAAKRAWSKQHPLKISNLTNISPEAVQSDADYIEEFERA